MVPRAEKLVPIDACKSFPFPYCVYGDPTVSAHAFRLYRMLNLIKKVRAAASSEAT
jgi:hypothetical protein